jgi:hypothetical protein
MKRYEEADADVYAGLVSEFGERMTFLETAAEQFHDHQELQP